jgi:putative DNA primase/helicase
MLAIEALAYSMTARTDLKASFWLVGQKDSGKSTFISMIKGIMGDLHTTIDLTQLGVNRFLLASIVGKHVVTFTEASGNTMLPDALYKALVGGSDEIYADVKNRDPIVFRPTAKVWWAMNEMPRVSDRSGATTRRIVIIPFNRTIPESERISDLEHRLMSERSGIFNELIYHLQRVTRAGGFDRCEQSERLLAEYILENDTEATFINEEAERGERWRVRSSTLYERYSAWCIRNGFKPKNSNQIAKEWRRLGFEYSRSDGSWWGGLRLRDHDE